nr:integrase, catalytic region, zinc finger, CCHC-type, peptidase aspartic, catalytic [Tanacetum cinerariifolium]
MKYQPKVSKPKSVGTRQTLATPKPRKSRLLLRWSPTGRLFNKEGKLVDSSESKRKSGYGDNACTSNILEPKIKLFPNSTSLLDSDFRWGNILITRVYFVEGLGHNLFSAGQFCNSDLEVAFRRDACFIRNLEGVDLLKRDRSTNLYTINLHKWPLHRQSVSWLEPLPLKNPDISFLHVFGALCYPKNDREDIRKLGAKGDIGFFIGYSADSCAYRVYNRRTKKIIETMNVSFDELFAMAFEQRSSKPRINSMTSGHISSGLDLTYAPSTITS